MANIIELRGPAQASPPAEAPNIIELSQAPKPEEKSLFSKAVDEVLAGLETTAAIAVPLVGEAAAGIGGLAKTITSGPEEGEKTINQIKEAFSFEPSLEETKRNLRAAGAILKPVGEALQKSREFLGDTVFEATDSPGLATAAFIIPDAIMEILGARGVAKLSRPGKVTKNASKLRKVIKRLEADNAVKMDKGVFPKAPSVDEIFDSAGIIYKEVDNFGATVKPEAFSQFSKSARKTAKEIGFDPDLTPATNRVLKRLDEAAESGVPLTTAEVDQLRKVARIGTQGIDPARKTDRAISQRIINQIDDLLDDAKNINVPSGVDPAAISVRLKAARKMHARGARAEIIGKALDAANLADNPVNSLKAQFRSLIDPRKKTAKMFNAAERKAIESYIKPGATISTLRVIGTLGFDLTNPRSIGNILIGSGGAGATAGGFGLLAGPLVALGTGTEWLAKRMLAKRGVFVDQMIRAGRDAKELTGTYLRVVKGKNRNPADMGKLLLGASPESIAKLPKTEFLLKAVEEMKKTKAAIKSKAVSKVVSGKRAFEEAIPAPALGLGSRNDEQ
jgi:hypothetical protein